METITEPSIEKYESILRRLFLTIKLELEQMYSDVKQGNFQLEERKNAKFTVDNYTNIIRRLIIKYRVEGVKNSYAAFNCASYLSLIHHSFYYRYELCVKENYVPSRKQLEQLRKNVTMYTTFYNAYYAFNLDLAEAVQEDKRKMLPQAMSMLATHPQFVFYLCEQIRLIQMAGTNIFAIKIASSQT